MAQRTQRNRSQTGGRSRGRPRKNQNTGVKSNSRAAVKTKTKVVPASQSKSRKNVENTGQTAGNNINSVALGIAPVILFIVAVYILVSFVISGNGTAQGIGVVGAFVKDMFYGLFGFVAAVVPVFMGSIAVFLKKDMRTGFFKYRLIFSTTCVVLYAAMFHLASLPPSAKEIKYSDIIRLYANGTGSVGGGVFGGYLAETFGVIVGPVGAWIFILPLSVVFSTFLFGFTPAGIVKAIVKLIRDYNADKKGFERKIIVQETPDISSDAERKFKPKTHRYTISSHVPNMPRKKFQPDIPLGDSPNNTKKKKKSKDGAYISDNPFASDFSEESEKAENIGIQASYETPLMLPSEELFDPQSAMRSAQSENNTGISGEAIGEVIDFDIDIDIPGDKSFEEQGDIKIVGSAPLTRDDEPDIAETTEKSGKNKDSINFETSKVFEFEDDMPVKKEYKLPPFTYLTKATNEVNVDISEELNTTAKKLTDTLASFGVRTKIREVSRGPSITRYEISPDSGVKVNSIVNLVNDISLNLAADVRIEAPIPGKSAIGVEVPNKNRETVHLRSLLEDSKFTNAASKITIALGKDVAGNDIYSDIAKMPHLLIAGATGSGKSICINVIIASILYKATPDEVKLILVDPKKVELNIYNGIPHLLVPVVSDPKKAAGALSWAVNEMENRYMLIEEKGVRNLKGYNDAIADDPFAEQLPQIVIIIDELADLMLTAPADVEQSVNRLAAKARAAGIHLIVGTQRPSVDVITGLIKANIPTRIAFTVVSQIDSRTIINMAGAEKLIGSGDMLYVPTGTKPIRVQGAFISDKDALNVIDFWKKQSDGQYDETILSEIEQEAARCNTKGAKIKDKDDDDTSADDEFKKDSALKSAIELAIDMGTVSTSLLQRKLGLGYARAARIVDTMERMNVIGPFEGSKPRRVLISRQDFIAMTMHGDGAE